MPKIQVYESRIGVPGPVDTPRANADTMGAAFGRGIEKFGSAVSEVADIVQKQNEDAEVSELNVKISEAQADFTTKWQEKVNAGDLEMDDGEGRVASNFNEALSEHLEGVREGIKTRKGELYFNQSSARLQGHFQETTAAGQSQMAGQKAVSDFQKAATARSSALLNDPTAFAMTVESNREDIEQRVSSKQLPRAVADKLLAQTETDYAKAAARGWKKSNPDYAQKLLDEGHWDQYFDADVKHQMYGEIDTEKRARKTQENLDRAENERIKSEKQDKFQSELFADVVRGKTAGIKDRILDSDLDFSRQRTMIDIVDKHASEKIKTNPQVYLNLLRRIQAPDGSPGKIVDDTELMAAAQEGHLTLTDLNGLRSEFSGRKSTEGKYLADAEDRFFNSIKKQITHSNDIANILDPQGDENYYKFWVEAKQAIKTHRESGKPMTELYDPKSENYLGKLLGGYRKGMSQIMNEQANTVLNMVPQVTPSPTPAPKKKDGESTTDFLKRLKGEK